MKINKKYILILSICMLGNLKSISKVPTMKVLTAQKTQLVMAENTLSIKNSVSTIKRGGAGHIIIHAMPNTRYSIRTSYKLGDKIIPVLQLRTTDKNGEATFNWIVSTETIPGTYNATIYGGGSTLETTHIVLK